MMTNKEILAVAMRQSAFDSCCEASDFEATVNKVILSSVNENARKYLVQPLFCDLTSYGNNIVASVDESVTEAVSEYISKYLVEHCFETPNIYVLNELLKKYSMKVCFMAEYFLPSLNILKPLPCPYETRLLTQEDLTELYIPEWSNALCEDRKNLDVLALGAYDGDKLVGLAGCSADCDTMWQIGVDVLPEYRRNGIAASLTSQLACEILNRDKVPFYCCAWSNICSTRNAIKSGFVPAWVQVTAKSFDFIEKINKS